MTGKTVCRKCDLDCDVKNIEYVGMVSACCTEDIYVINQDLETQKIDIKALEEELNGVQDTFKVKI